MANHRARSTSGDGSKAGQATDRSGAPGKMVSQVFKRHWRMWARLTIGMILIPAFVFTAFSSLDRAGFFDLSDLQISTPHDQIQRSYHSAWLETLNQKLASAKGTPLWKLDLMKLTDELRHLAWVESLSLVRNWPHSLQVNVRMKEVKLVLMNSKAEFFPIVGDGTMLGAVDVQRFPDAPLLIGKNFETSDKSRKDTLKLISLIPMDGLLSAKTISEIRFEEKQGYLFVLNESGIKVRFGQLSSDAEMLSKIRRVSAVLAYMHEHQMQARVIDADLAKKVVVRLRKDP